LGVKSLRPVAPNHPTHHSWGEELFRNFFERIVLKCVDEGLVDGTKIFMDGSLIDADASNSSVIDRHSLKRYLKAGYKELEKKAR